MLKPFFSGLFLGILLIIVPLAFYITRKIDTSQTNYSKIKSPIMNIKRRRIQSPISKYSSPKPIFNEGFQCLSEIIGAIFTCPAFQKKITNLFSEKIKEHNFELSSLLFHPSITPTINNIEKFHSCGWKVTFSWNFDDLSLSDDTLLSLFLEGSLSLNWPLIEAKKCIGRIPASLMLSLHALSLSFIFEIRDNFVTFTLLDEDFICDIEIGSGFGIEDVDNIGGIGDSKGKEGILKLQTIANTMIHEKISKILKSKKVFKIDLL